MSSQIILECNQNNADIKDETKSSWTNVFKEAIPIQEGDVLRMNQALLNSGNSGQQVLTLDKDTIVSIKFGYYETIFNADIPTHGKKPHLYRGYNGITGKTAPTNVNTSETGNHDYTTDQDTGSVKYYTLWETSNNDDITRFQPTNLKTNTFSYEFKAGSYSPMEIAQTLTEEMSKDKNFLITPDAVNLVMFDLNRADKFDSDPITAGTQFPNQYRYVSDSDGNARLIGSSQTQFAYDNNRFQIKYFHTPIYQSSNDTLTQIVARTYIGHTAREEIYKQQSGCFITDLQPASFWDLLGFTQDHNTSNIYPPSSVSDVNGNTPITDFEKYITGNFFGNNDYVSVDSDIAISKEETGQVSINRVESDATEELNSKDTFQSVSGGFYLIEAETILNNQYFTNEKRYNSIIGIASQQYNNADYITVYGGESSLTYEHKGEPQLLTSVKINILDPQSKKIVSGLGNQSCVFLELLKAQKIKKD